MPETFLIGLDFGSESARGVLIDVRDGRQAAYHVHPYRHGIMTEALPGGRPLPAGFALQDAADYLEAAENILTAIGAGRDVAGIGVDFTASSPLPALADGRAMSEVAPDEPHAYVEALEAWRRRSLTPRRSTLRRRVPRAISAARLSGEWMLAKAAQIAAEAPEVWRAPRSSSRPAIGWSGRLAGREARSLDFAAYKAQYVAGGGYPDEDRSRPRFRSCPRPQPVGSPAGQLSDEWRRANRHSRRGCRRCGGDQFACRSPGRRRPWPWRSRRRARHIGGLSRS